MYRCGCRDGTLSAMTGARNKDLKHSMESRRLRLIYGGVGVSLLLVQQHLDKLITASTFCWDIDWSRDLLHYPAVVLLREGRPADGQRRRDQSHFLWFTSSFIHRTFRSTSSSRPRERMSRAPGATALSPKSQPSVTRGFDWSKRKQG